MDDTKTQFDQIVAGLEPAPIACGRRDHAAGRYGCEQDQPAAYILAVHHCGEPGRPHRLLVCQGSAIRYQSVRDQFEACATCGKRGIVSDFIEVLGPIPA
jgi:hypothetical protein